MTKNSKREKIIKKLRVLGGATILTGSFVICGVAIGKSDESINHCEDICLMSKVLGTSHQLAKIREENSSAIPVYNDTKIINLNFEYYKVEPNDKFEKRMVKIAKYDENGNIIGFEEKEHMVEALEFVKSNEISVSADKNEIKICNIDTGEVKTLKLK